MSAEVAKALPKPEMRRLLYRQIRTNLIVAISLCAVSAVAYKVCVGDARKQRYAEFYKNYDAQKAFERMKQKGLFQSCPPGS